MQFARFLHIFFNMKKVTARFIYSHDIVNAAGNIHPKPRVKHDKKVFNMFMTIAGTVFLCIGCLGIVLPLLPTAPFILLTFYFYSKAGRKIENKKLLSLHARIKRMRPRK